jgi:hypothetical protein
MNLSLNRTAALLALGLVGSLGLGAIPASADDLTAPPVPSQSAPEAIAEKTITNNDIKITVVRSKGAAEIAKRQVSLSSNQAKLATMTTDCGFNAARASEMTATSTGLATLGGQLAATTDLATAKSLYGKIFTEYRVYLVVLPKAGKAMRCDHYLTRIADFNADAAKLQTTIDAAKAGGADTTASQALKDAAVASVAALNPSAAITPCMGLVPDKGDKTVQAANAAALTSCDGALDAVGASLKAARAQLEQSRAALRTARATDKAADKATREAAREAQKAADKAARDAQKAADKAAKDAAKVLVKS